MVRQPLLVLTAGAGGERARELATQICLANRACLTVAHVLDTSCPWWAGTVGGSAEYRAARTEARSEGERLLATVRDAMPGDLSVRTCVLHDPERPGTQVLRALSRSRHDLLVVEAPNPWPGQCSGWLLRHSPVPVLTVGAHG
jgi:nucleotide-binding universal stress UspA family protein